MEEEAREILRSALLSRPNLNDNLADIVRRRFAPLGGVELEPPPRDPIRKAEALFDIDLKDRVIGFDSDAARIFSRIAAHRRQQGKPISNPDAQVCGHRALTQRHACDSQRCRFPRLWRRRC